MRQPRFDVYQDKAGFWRWRLYAANGRTIADSGEGYAKKSNADRAVRVLTNTVTRIGNQASLKTFRASMLKTAAQQLARTEGLRTHRYALRNN